MKKVSVLVPVYGVEKYIGQCARSLFEQTYENIEYIFVDDCSKDGSIAILRQTMEDYPARKSQTAIIRHERNKGLGGARLTALLNATGEYITHVDSDDFMPRDAIASLMAKAEESGADMIDGGYAEWEDGKAAVCRPAPHIRKEKYLKAILCQNILPNRIWGRLYRRSMLTGNGVFSVEGIDFSEDYAVVPRAMFHSRMAYTDKTVYCYRKDNASSYTHTVSEKHLLSHLRACQLVADFFMNTPGGERYRSAVDIGIVNAYRCTVENGFDPAVADREITYKPKSTVCRICIMMLRRDWSATAVNMLYLAYRKLYIHLA